LQDGLAARQVVAQAGQRVAGDVFWKGVKCGLHEAIIA